ncbi:ABC transporter permease [Pseudosulfitobacter pseudonitzschiae]|uniref:ABC transporter permease n=1 Tax=Pseudosulfitobacter pseudonitzschiae TaxID=1402135 RepID=A0A073IZY9_9RHOB|nr:ABC transporter permease [Pseudosulfitobacter pseudonitzschiae]KEJ95175.1 ABC transporter permease [Pseudosulfitobacter pseudonitzschiae]MBM1816792.1 ABC transporter permease [Pseudosulfitobacter pseudonitzschiae]MBM1833603.1 ABC transporter permease [Pseudosulfitobacter pseudonitzschiae]MBM1838469.1 ABC transporter permease [Pseudosulfitobacter pseudonitzschiae]MBM1843520.1 ABC transporter permease [Pseudosulfitobacter pseudonitzschiae]
MTATETQPSRATRSVNLKVLGPILALVVLVIVGAALNGNFLSAANITNVLSRSAFIGIIAVGMTFVITAGGLDLSVGSMAAFIAGLMILVMNAMLPTMGPGWPLVFVGMLTAMVAGTLAGFVNGFLITTMRIEAFIVTLGTMGIYRSLVTWLADGGTLSLDFGMRSVIRPIYFDGILGISWPIIVFALVAIIGELVMRRAAFGRHAAAVGSNDQVARYSSVNVNRVRMLTYVFLGILVGVATIMYVPRLGSASPSTGVLWELEAIAAVIIGGTMLKGGFGRVWGTVIGVLILSLIDNILNLTDGVSPYLNGAIQGVIIILAVILQRDKKAES